MFHWVTGIPFENDGGAYDDLTLWEQIDDGAQYTPAKKWLFCVPVVLYVPPPYPRALADNIFYLGFWLQHITQATIPGYLL
jgi:hypothetical protein